MVAVGCLVAAIIVHAPHADYTAQPIGSTDFTGFFVMIEPTLWPWLAAAIALVAVGSALLVRR